jgi:hypothetical protein
VPDLPLTALRDLLRTKGDYADWRAFYRAITPEQARWLRVWREEIASFTLAEELLGTSLSVDDFAHAWLVMEILEHLPPAQRDSLWSYQGDRSRRRAAGDAASKRAGATGAYP